MTKAAPQESMRSEQIQRLVAILKRRQPGEPLVLPGWVNEDLMFEAKKVLGMTVKNRPRLFVRAK